MSETLSISLETWLQWRQEVELLQDSSGAIPLEVIMNTLDRLDQLFVRKDSNPASTRESYASLPGGRGRINSAKGARARDSAGTPLKIVKKDASTQLYTVRQGFLSKHVLQSVKHQFSTKVLSKQVGVLASRVAALAADLLKVLALWITGSSVALDPLGTSRSSSPGSTTADCLTELEADDLLDVPPSIVHILHPETAQALFAYMPSALRAQFLPCTTPDPKTDGAPGGAGAGGHSPPSTTTGTNTVPPRHHLHHQQQQQQPQPQHGRSPAGKPSASLNRNSPSPLLQRQQRNKNNTSENEANPTECLTRVLTAWGATRAHKGRAFSSPILRRGWVCRICRRDASRMYAYDKTNRRLDHVDDENWTDPSGQNTFRHKRRISTLYRPHRPALPQPSSPSGGVGVGASPTASTHHRGGSSRGVSPQRQLCGIGFSKTLRAASPEDASTLFNNSFLSRTTGYAGEDRQAVLNGRNAVLHHSKGKASR